MNCREVKFGLAMEKRYPSIHSMGKMQWKLGGATLLVTFKNRIDQILAKVYCSCSSTASDCYLCYFVPVVGQTHSKRESLFS